MYFSNINPILPYLHFGVPHIAVYTRSHFGPEEIFPSLLLSSSFYPYPPLSPSALATGQQ